MSHKPTCPCPNCTRTGGPLIAAATIVLAIAALGVQLAAAHATGISQAAVTAACAVDLTAATGVLAVARLCWAARPLARARQLAGDMSWQLFTLARRPQIENTSQLALPVSSESVAGAVVGHPDLGTRSAVRALDDSPRVVVEFDDPPPWLAALLDGGRTMTIRRG